MKKITRKIYGIFLALCLLGNNFLPILRVYAETTEVTAKITMKVSGSDLEYTTDTDGNGDVDSHIYFTINKNKESDPFRFKPDEIDYDLDQEQNKIGFETDELDYEYNGDTEDTTVTFTFYTSWDDVITSLKINDNQYDTPQTKQELSAAFTKDGRKISFDVVVDKDNDNEYEVVIEGRKLTESELYMGNFLWTYNESDEVSNDEKIPHGTLEFIEAEYNGVTYSSVSEINEAGNIYEWKDGEKKSNYNESDKTNRTGIGEAMFPVGTKLTLKLIPDKGYQLVSLRQNDNTLEVGEDVGTYTFTIEGGNFHLGAVFEEVGNVVSNSSSSIASGSINININNETSFTYGTAKLEVSDTNPTTAEDFEEEVPEGYEIDNYLDISLYNTVYKGVNDPESSWDTEIDELDNTATISLKMTEDMSGKDIKVIHEEHDGDTVLDYDVISASYDEETNTISFPTDGFSNYAIISKNTNVEDYEVSDANGNIIEFENQPGNTYTFDMLSYIGITDDELEALGMSKEEYNTAFAGIKNVTKEFGDVLGIYEVILVDGDDQDIHEGPFTIKIKITDEMEDYNTFNMIFVDVENGFLTEEPIDLEVDGEYLVGTLEHLSVYTLVGSNTSVENPQTSDGITSSVILGSISLISLILCGLYINKKKHN